MTRREKRRSDRSLVASILIMILLIAAAFTFGSGHLIWGAVLAFVTALMFYFQLRRCPYCGSWWTAVYRGPSTVTDHQMHYRYCGTCHKLKWLDGTENPR
ncbi:MAG TPA: LapA family protein [Candidatus Paceibacterota bacterium]|nr:LapA family protein [Candidatus Paceibacterota bacterium]